MKILVILYSKYFEFENITYKAGFLLKKLSRSSLSRIKMMLSVTDWTVVVSGFPLIKLSISPIKAPVSNSGSIASWHSPINLKDPFPIKNPNLASSPTDHKI